MEINIAETLDLYKINRLAGANHLLNVQIELNENHPVFQGHFPGIPILPGVYLIQIIKDSLNTFLTDAYQMKSAGSVKYLKPVEPGKNKILRMEMSLTESIESLSVSAISVLEDETIHFKFKGDFAKL